MEEASGLIIRLATEHIPALRDLIESQPKHIGLPKELVLQQVRLYAAPGNIRSSFNEQLLQNLEENYLSGSTGMQMHGYLREGKLWSTIGMRFSETEPAWLLTRMFSYRGKGPRATGIFELFDHCIRQGEGLGATEYHTCGPAKHAEAHERLWSARVPARGRYMVCTDALVPAGTKPYFQAHYERMEGMCWPIDLVLRRQVLKDEFRAHALASQGRRREVEIARWGGKSSASQQVSGGL